MPLAELPFLSNAGEYVQIPSLPGMINIMPPLMPDLAGSPTWKANSPL